MAQEWAGRVAPRYTKEVWFIYVAQLVVIVTTAYNNRGLRVKS